MSTAVQRASFALALGALATCAEAQAPAAGPAAPAASAPATPAAGAHRFKIGALDAMVFRDGGGAFPNDGKVIGVDEGAPAVAEVLKGAGLPSDTLKLDINVLLVRAGPRTFLFDTGNGPKVVVGGLPPGTLLAGLKAAGVDPAEVTDIVISHGHGDHVGGLTRADGSPAFPKAKVRMTAGEWAAIRANARAADLVKAITPQVETFEPGAVLAPGITAVEVRGHTPGHTGVLIESAGARVLTIGDTAHHYVISLRKPEFTIAFDGDAPTAEASRRALLTRAVDEKLTVFAPHFPYPGLGAVRREGDGFAWVPKP